MELLKKLTATYGVSGEETAVRDILKEELSGLGEITVSPLGNLTLNIKGSGEKLMFAAHMDEIGVMITYIEDNGFLRFAPVGGVEARSHLHCRVTFACGVRGIICCGDKLEAKDVKISNMFIDIGARDKQHAQSLVSVGMCGCFDGDFMQRGDFITSKALDDRIGCYALVQAAKKIKNNKKDLYFVFTTQEELGLRGAMTAAFGIDPDYAVAVDVTPCGDTPDSPKLPVKLGEGAALKVKDAKIISSPAVKELITSAAKALDIKMQYEVLATGAGDAGALQCSGGGIPSGAVSIPCRYLHTADETVCRQDVEDVISIITYLGEN